MLAQSPSTLYSISGEDPIILAGVHLSALEVEAVLALGKDELPDGIILGSPGYHGSISGLVKNALDYAEDLRSDPRPYFSGRAVGCIATAAGWPGAVNTLSALREIVHALRGWPTPLGAAINSAENVFDEGGGCLVPRVAQTLELMTDEVMSFARAIAPR